jgi:hypothetical protein
MNRLAYTLCACSNDRLCFCCGHMAVWDAKMFFYEIKRNVCVNQF